MESEWEQSLVWTDSRFVVVSVRHILSAYCCKPESVKRGLALQNGVSCKLVQGFAVLPEFLNRCTIAMSRHGLRKLQGSIDIQGTELIRLPLLLGCEVCLARSCASQSMKDLVR